MKGLGIVPLVALVASVVGLATVLVNGPLSGSSPGELPLATPPGAQPELALEPRPSAPGTADLLALPSRRAAVDAGADRSGDGAVEGPAAGGRASKAATLAELLEFREFVDTTLTEVRAERAAEERRTLEKRAERMDETMPALEERLSLTSAQSDELRSVLLARFDREAEYLWLWEKGADEEILGELKRTDHEAYLRELARILTSEQLATYLAGGHD